MKTIFNKTKLEKNNPVLSTLNSEINSLLNAESLNNEDQIKLSKLIGLVNQYNAIVEDLINSVKKGSRFSSALYDDFYNYLILNGKTPKSSYAYVTTLIRSINDYETKPDDYLVDGDLVNKLKYAFTHNTAETKFFYDLNRQSNYTITSVITSFQNFLSNLNSINASHISNQTLSYI